MARSPAPARRMPAALLAACLLAGCVAAPGAELRVGMTGNGKARAVPAPERPTGDARAAAAAIPARAAAAKVVAAAGARLMAADATVEATVPAGALDHDAAVRITRLPAPEGATAAPLAAFTADLGGAKLGAGARLEVRISLDDAAAERAAGLPLAPDAAGRPQLVVALEGPALRPADPTGSGLRVEVEGTTVMAFRAASVGPSPLATLPPGGTSMALPSAAPGWWMPAPRATATPTPAPSPTPTPPPPALPAVAPTPGPTTPEPTPMVIPTVNPAAVMPPRPTATPRPPAGTLSDVFVTGRYASLVIRDYGAEDGDRVQVLLNGVPVPGGGDVELREAGTALPLTLELGENQLRIVALGTGTTGPNTLEVTLTNVTVRSGASRQVGEALLTGDALTWRLVAE